MPLWQLVHFSLSMFRCHYVDDWEGMYWDNTYNTTLALWNERSPLVRTCRADCLTCPVLIRENQFVSNTTGRKYFAIDSKIDEIHCELQNYTLYTYLLTCSHCGIDYFGENIIPFNLRMNIKSRGKSGCEISIDHYWNIYKKATFINPSH